MRAVLARMAEEDAAVPVEQLSEFEWEIPREGDMHVPARVFASGELLELIRGDRTLEQARNITQFPGIHSYACVLPDAHQGYGMPVGGVVALDAEEGGISPGAIGYDINCGVRVMTTSLSYADVQGKEQQLANILFSKAPSGLGKGAVAGTLEKQEVEEICTRGMRWALDEGYAVADDLEHCEDEGFRDGALPGELSEKAKDRARHQVGSLGSGNHFLEVQRVGDIYDEDAAAAYGLETDQVVVMIHCGSRGLGHQTCSDFLRKIEQEHQAELEALPDKELAYAPAGSELEEKYYGAMNAAINFAWVNRQLIMHQVRRCFETIFDRDWQEMDMDLLYDVAHNIGKKEVHEIDGEDREVYVHRKGATRAFPAGHPLVPDAYRDVGQPVLLPGSMGTASYVLKGTETAMEKTFGSSAHGAGRTMSRTQAKKDYWGEDVQQELERRQIYVKAQSGASIAEEAPGVYKDVDEVVRVTDAVGIGDKVARMHPVVNIKG